MKRGWKIGLIVLSIIIVFLIDVLIFDVISLIRIQLLDDLLLGLTFFSSTIILFFVFTSLFLYSEKKRRWILPLWVILGLDVIIAFLMKFFIARARPYQEELISILPILVSKSHFIWDFSFPSFHAMVVFSSIPLIVKEFPKIKNFWIVAAVIIALSRLYFGLHYLTDIFFGGLIGYGIGYFIVKIEEKHSFGMKLYNKIKSLFS